MSDQQKAFRFLDLPAELRCLIYSYLLRAKYAIKLEPGTSKYRTRGRASDTIHSGRACALIHARCHPEVEAGIVFVNRLVYTEAIPFLYSENIFTAADPVHLKFFVGSIGRSVEGLREVSLCEVRITSQSRFKPGFKAMIQVLKRAKNLRTLGLSQKAYQPGAASTHFFVKPTEVFDALIPLLRALHRSSKNGAETARPASELLSVQIIKTETRAWRILRCLADKLQMELKTLLDNTVLL